jgi:hypothetical protein
MVDLTPTPELVAAAYAADAGEAWRNPDGTSEETNMAVLGLSDPVRDITEEADLLEAAGILLRAPMRHGTGHRWQVTDAGRQWLADNDKEI